MLKKKNIILLVVCVLFGIIVKYGIIKEEILEGSRVYVKENSTKESSESLETNLTKEAEALPNDDLIDIESNTTLEDSNNEYILPDVRDRYLTESDLIHLNKDMLRLARNEVYARHGRKFETEDLKLYFNAQSWYQGVLSQEKFDDSVLNEYEKYNLDLIKSVEKK